MFEVTGDLMLPHPPCNPALVQEAGGAAAPGDGGGAGAGAGAGHGARGVGGVGVGALPAPAVAVPPGPRPRVRGVRRVGIRPAPAPAPAVGVASAAATAAAAAVTTTAASRSTAAEASALAAALAAALAGLEEHDLVILHRLHLLHLLVLVLVKVHVLGDCVGALEVEHEAVLLHRAPLLRDQAGAGVAAPLPAAGDLAAAAGAGVPPRHGRQLAGVEADGGRQLVAQLREGGQRGGGQPAPRPRHLDLELEPGCARVQGLAAAGGHARARDGDEPRGLALHRDILDPGEHNPPLRLLLLGLVMPGLHRLRLASTVPLVVEVGGRIHSLIRYSISGNNLGDLRICTRPRHRACLAAAAASSLRTAGLGLSSPPPLSFLPVFIPDAEGDRC